MKTARVIALVVISVLLAVGGTMATYAMAAEDTTEDGSDESDVCYLAAQDAYWLNAAWHDWKQAKHNYDLPGAGTDEERQLLQDAATEVEDLQDTFNDHARKCAAQHPEAGNGKA